MQTEMDAKLQVLIDALVFKIFNALGFHPPVSVGQLKAENTTDRLLPAVVARRKLVLAGYKVWITIANG